MTLCENEGSGQPECGDFLVQGATLPREKCVAESTALFHQSSRQASAKSIAQAQVLVGLGLVRLGSARLGSRGGWHSRSYSRLLYRCSQDLERSHDADCRESASSVIAHVYADMRDHTLAAAWFDYQLESISSDFGNGQRRIDITGARDCQMRLGHVSEELCLRLEDASPLTWHQTRAKLR